MTLQHNSNRVPRQLLRVTYPDEATSWKHKVIERRKNSSTVPTPINKSTGDKLGDRSYSSLMLPSPRPNPSPVQYLTLQWSHTSHPHASSSCPRIHLGLPLMTNILSFRINHQQSMGMTRPLVNRNQRKIIEGIKRSPSVTSKDLLT
jgi:hypothetical protein